MQTSTTVAGPSSDGSQNSVKARTKTARTEIVRTRTEHVGQGERRVPLREWVSERRFSRTLIETVTVETLGERRRVLLVIREVV